MNSSHNLALSTLAAQTLLFSFMTAVGVCVPITLVAQIVGLPFRVYLIACPVAVLPGIALVIWTSLRKLKSVKRKDTPNLAILLVVCILGMVLALITHYASSDDYYYVPNAVYFLQNPDQPMDFDIHQIAVVGDPIVAHSQQTSLAYDYARAVIAYYARLEYLAVYYLLSTAVAGFLLPVALYFLVTQLVDDTTHALIGSIAAVALLLVLLDTHRAFGNLAFPRVFQGKVVVLSIGIPAFAAFSVAYLLAKPTGYYWTAIFMTSLAMLGMTASAVALLPALAIALACGLIAADFPIAFRKTAIKRVCFCLIAYFASLGYVFLYALFLKIHTAFDYGMDSSVNALFPTDFVGHMNLFINPHDPRTPVAIIGSTVLAFLLLKGRNRRFLAGWVLALAILFLNPLVSPFLIRYVTTPNIYWRLVYLYPFPLMAAVSVAIISSRLEMRVSPSVRFGSVAVILLLCTGSYLWEENQRGDLRWPAYKINDESLEIARAISAAAPPGVMLTPLPDPHLLYGIIPMLQSGQPQMLIYHDSVVLWLPDREERSMRFYAAQFAGGMVEGRNAFDSLLKQGLVRTVVLKKEVFNDPSTRALLDSHGFVNHQGVDEYVVVWRPSEPDNTRPDDRLEGVSDPE